MSSEGRKKAGSLVQPGPGQRPGLIGQLFTKCALKGQLKLIKLPFQGENTKINHFPKAMPWAMIICPFGTQNKKLHPEKRRLVRLKVKNG